VWGSWVTITAATADTDGMEQRTCSRDATHKESRVITAFNHKHIWDGVWVRVKEPTCTETGILAQTCMLNPAHLDSYAIAINQTAHEWGDWALTTPPTDTTAGVETRVCIYNASHTETRDALYYFNVTFDSNGGTPSTIPSIRVEGGNAMGTQFPANPTKTISPNVFIGWYLSTDVTFSGIRYTSITPITANTALKARWGIALIFYYDVSFDTNGGTPASIASIQVEGGNALGTQFPADPSKDGYTFGGWYLSSDTDFSGTQYTSNIIISAVTSLKARWIEL
jgi:uncharacterized repeat protein (TIGR02543 family)